jgi:exopolysaccharide biosynthesis polyprenyl glycosylphosphotransferase
VTTRPVVRASSRRAATGPAFREAELRLLLLVGDVLVAGAAAIAAPAVLDALDDTFVPSSDLRSFEIAFVLGWVVLLRILGGGDLSSPRFGRRMLGAVGRTTAAAAALILITFFFAPFFAPRSSTLLTVPLVAAAALAWRYGYLRATRSRTLERRVAIIGTDAAARRAASAIKRWDGMISYDLVAFIGPTSGASDVQGTPVIAIADEPWTTIKELDVDLLVVGHTRSVPAQLLAELTRCFEHGVEAVPATLLYEQLTGRVLAPALEADWYAALPTYTLGLYTFGKRVFDILVAIVAGIVALVLTPFIAAAITLDTGSPILLRQTRVGLRGEPFVLHKFRTMRADAEASGKPQWSTPGDTRITRVGRVLRRTRLDELPQLWDVLVGNMSLIGPRPERPEFVEQLAHELPLYRARSLVRPGITGWAQVMFPYAETIERNLAKLEYDLYYIRHLGLLLDVAILLRTLPAVVAPQRHDEAE